MPSNRSRDPIQAEVPMNDASTDQQARVPNVECLYTRDTKDSLRSDALKSPETGFFRQKKG